MNRILQLPISMEELESRAGELVLGGLGFGRGAETAGEVGILAVP